MKSVVEQAREKGIILREGMTLFDVRKLGLDAPKFLCPSLTLHKDTPEVVNSPIFSSSFGGPTGWNWMRYVGSTAEYLLDCRPDIKLSADEQEDCLGVLVRDVQTVIANSDMSEDELSNFIVDYLLVPWMLYCPDLSMESADAMHGKYTDIVRSMSERRVQSVPSTQTEDSARS